MSNDEIKLYCISLPRSVRRRERMVERFHDFPSCIRTSFVDAVDPTSIEVCLIMKDYPNPTLPKWKDAACLVSHLKALSTFLASGDSEALICEDDVCFIKDFQYYLTKVREWDNGHSPMVCLSYMAFRGPSKIESIDIKIAPGYTMYSGTRDDSEIWGNQLYLIRRPHAERMLQGLSKPMIELPLPQTSELIQWQPEVRYVAPFLAIEDMYDSEMRPIEVVREYHGVFWNHYPRQWYNITSE